MVHLQRDLVVRGPAQDSVKEYEKEGRGEVEEEVKRKSEYRNKGVRIRNDYTIMKNDSRNNNSNDDNGWSKVKGMVIRIDS